MTSFRRSSAMALLLAASAAARSQPHLVFVMLDDWGYNDVGWRSTDRRDAAHRPALGRGRAAALVLLAAAVHARARGAHDGALPAARGHDARRDRHARRAVGGCRRRSTLAEGLRALGSSNAPRRQVAPRPVRQREPARRARLRRARYLSGEEDYYTHATRGYADFAAVGAGALARARRRAGRRVQHRASSRRSPRASSRARRGRALGAALPVRRCSWASIVSSGARALARGCGGARRYPNADRRTFCAMAAAAVGVLSSAT